MTLTELQSRITPGVLIAADGLVTARDGSAITAEFRPYPDWTGPVNVATDGQRIYTAPGMGGGPILSTFLLDGEPLGAVFVGDPASRNGASLAGLVEKEPSPLAQSLVRLDPDRPATATQQRAAQLLLDRVSPDLLALASVARTPVVLAARTDGGFGATGFFDGFAARVSLSLDRNIGGDGSAYVVLHELGHAVDLAVLTVRREPNPSQSVEWLNARGLTGSPYFDTAPNEAWANGFALTAMGRGGELPGTAEVYFARIFAEGL
jgi:hypothetical protein